MAHELLVIGGGNMGSALLAGLLTSGRYTPDEVAVVESVADRRAELHERHGVAAAALADDVPAPTAVLAVKPPAVAEVAVEAVRAGARRLVSIAAGITTAAIERAVDDAGVAGGDTVVVVRAMPNTPALIGRGMTAVCGGRDATDADLEWAESLLGAVGTCVRLDESHFDAVTALTGSGPAYVFLVAEALVDAGVRAGLPEELVPAMVSDLLVGSAALLAERGDPARLREQVTSPGGTTAAGLAALDAHGLRDAFAAAVDAAAARSRELGAPTGG